MGVDLTGRHFVKELDFTAQEWSALVELTGRLKAARLQGREERTLLGKAIALVFEKTSTRTRCAFEVAAYQLGAQLTYLDPHGSQFGHKESAKDTARVLGRLYDGIEFRGSRHEVIETLAGMPGCRSTTGSPTCGTRPSRCATSSPWVSTAPSRWAAISFAYVGDARYNMGNSLLVAGAMSGMDTRIVAPQSLWPDAGGRRAAPTGSPRRPARQVTLTEDLAGVAGVDFVHTDVWVSMGEPDEVWAERIALLTPYQVTTDLMRSTGNPDTRFMHCLPAFHDRETSVGERVYQQYGMDALEVTDEVFESPASIVFDQSENRMHTVKAVLSATLAGVPI